MSSSAGRDVLGRGLRVLGQAIRTEPRLFVVGTIGSSVFGLLVIANSYVVGAVIGRVVVPAFAGRHVRTGELALIAAAFLGISVLRVGSIFGRRLGAGFMQFRLQARYRRAVTRRYLSLPPSWHQQHATGTLLSNANSDVEAAFVPIAPLPFAVGTIVMIFAAVLALFLTDWVLAMVGVTLFPLLFGLNYVYSRRMSPRQIRAQQMRAKVSAVAHESFDGALVVKTMGREEDESRRFGVFVTELRDALISVGRLRGLFDPVMDALPSLGTLAVLAVATARVASGAVQTGAVVQVTYTLSLLAFPIRAIGWVLAELPRTVAGDERLQAVLRATTLTAWGGSDARGSGPAQVGAQAVGYRHPVPAQDPLERPADAQVPAPTAPGPAPAPASREHAPALDGVDLEVTAGSTVAVVGSTGAGKSTLAGLLVRLVDPTSGRVLLDGVDLRELREGALAQVAALVPQTTFVFDDTVRGNIALGLDDADVPADRRVDDAAVWDALRLAQADGFVAALPEGLDTPVGERGSTLSGGQRQRLALARALVRRPRLLVLDDATSALDPGVERAVLDGLRAAGRGTTVVVVAYRPATIALADEVVHLDQGRVVDRGPAEEVAARDPGYRELVTAYARAAADREAARGMV